MQILKGLPEGSGFIHYEPGDGFKSLLPHLLCEDDLVIAPLAWLSHRYAGSKTTATTLHRLHKLKGFEYRRVIIDHPLPSPKAKVVATLVAACVGKDVLIVQRVDPSRLPTLYQLISGNDLKVYGIDREWTYAQLKAIYDADKSLV
jgi:hypothetical protein